MKYITLSLIIIAALTGCKKENDRVFNETPEQRLTETLTKYEEVLTGAPYGWKARVVTDSGKGVSHGFYFKFDNKNRVSMYSDFTDESSVTSKESSYRLKALQQVSLLFDTYSYIHVLADPDPRVAGGEVGTGYGVDFEFYFDGVVSNDSVNLVGIKNGSTALLIRATKEEADAYAAGGLADAALFPQYLNTILTYWKVIVLNGVTYQITVSADSRTISMSWIDGSGNAQIFNSGFYYTSTGIEFNTPFTNGTVKVTGFTNISPDAGNNTINVSANGSTASIAGSANPIYVDKAAAKRWWDYSVAQNDYWYSLSGFHVNGVDDAYGLRNLPNFLALWYQANAVALPNGTGDAVRFSGTYGPIVKSPPTFTEDGRAIFTNSGYAYNPPTGTPLAPYNNTRSKLFDLSGYYFVQTGESSYDMVIASDAKSWITWLF